MFLFNLVNKDLIYCLKFIPDSKTMNQMCTQMCKTFNVRTCVFFLL